MLLGMPHPRRDDLAAMLTRLAREATTAEAPHLDRHGLRMWEYVILMALETGPAQTQAQLAGLTGRDKTRLIADLDALAAQDLITRTTDPADRRNRVITLTARGQRLLKRCRDDIRAAEPDVLAPLTATERGALISSLEKVASRLRQR